MPWVTINLMEGRTDKQKNELYSSVTESISKSLDVPAEYVRIQLVEMTKENHAIGGKILED